MEAGNRQRTWRLVAIGAVLLGNVLMWAIPSNIERLIVRDRDILLGRYSVERVSALILLVPVSIVAVRLILSEDRKRLKLRVFRTLAVLMVLLPGTVIIDVVWRATRETGYVHTGEVFTRPAGQRLEFTITDVPENANVRLVKAYPPFDCSFSIDDRGFRNSGEARDAYDFVTIGDSFTEGSTVSDEHGWPVLLAAQTGKTVYNLGVAGKDPMDYLATLKKYGQEVSPSTVVCMLYEGNDFRMEGNPVERAKATGERKRTRSFSQWLRYLKKSSPVISESKQTLIDWFAEPPPSGPAKETTGGGAGAVKPSGVLSWLPVEVEGNNYMFSPKRLLCFYREPAEFVKHENWLNMAHALGEIKTWCDQHSARMVVLYAPSKPRVLLPLFARTVPAKKIHAYALMKRGGLPPAGTFVPQLIERSTTMSDRVSSFCAEREIGYLDLTEALRERAAAGKQVYFTYDQHWSPLGHVAVAAAVAKAFVR